MQIVADLHLHSKFSRAVSPQMTLPFMAQVAQQKGLDLLSAADFTHPVWFKEISSLLEEEKEGVYTLKHQISNEKPTRFILSTEIACISKHKDKLRRIHNLIFAPNLETVAKINAALVKRGVNLNADGRPIMGLTSKNVLELILEIDQRCFLIPAHVWTPHFGIYGSASGYDAIAEAFDDLAQYIYGIETGLSSDPDMNWSMPELRHRSILSFSDAHSAPKMGREATVFELAELTYMNLKKAIMRPMMKGTTRSTGITSTTSLERESFHSRDTRGTRDTSRILYTLEFYPEEGKYHYSGHRNCKVAYGPEEIRGKGNVCPVCRRKMTEGVLYRVQQLAAHQNGARQADEDLTKRLREETKEHRVKWFTDKEHEQPPYVKVVPLLEIVAESMHFTVNSQKAQTMFNTLITTIGSELDILLKVPLEEIANIGGERVAEGVQKVREGNIVIEPGYDGEYGKVAIWNEAQKNSSQPLPKNQLSLDL